MRLKTSFEKQYQACKQGETTQHDHFSTFETHFADEIKMPWGDTFYRTFVVSDAFTTWPDYFSQVSGPDWPTEWSSSPTKIQAPGRPR